MATGGGGNLSELYSNSKRLLLKTRDALERLERLEYKSSSVSSSLSTSNGVVSGTSDDPSIVIRRDIIQIQSLCSDMDRLWRSIAAKSQRDLWKMYLPTHMCTYNFICNTPIVWISWDFYCIDMYGFKSKYEDWLKFRSKMLISLN
ncbi:membrin-11-like [Olea europaea var. sylvestris]|uniref:membrin-11-like n=1 Tax=Olea europaea var. sylvestris TaxID=158386 RepID=UPI000C1D8D1C|nr:membrin-11-like [Olea europaea var. sylvestris]